MTERQKQMIAGYLPNPRDPELNPFDYYVEDMRGRAVTVHIYQIALNIYGTSIYQVRTASGNLVHGPYETDPELLGGGWYTMGSLYDNREDCIHSAHSMFDGWEELRKLQQKEVAGCTGLQ